MTRSNTHGNGDLEQRPRTSPPQESSDRRQNYRYHPYYPTNSPSSYASFKGCCCCLFLLFSFLALLLLALVLIVVLALKPKKPQFDLQQVGVQYMGITTPNPTSPTDSYPSVSSPTSASLSLNILLLFIAVNPNKVGIKYGESRFTVMYRGIPLGEASVPGFFQAAHSERQLEAKIAVDRVNLLQADASDLIRDATLNDRVELRILGEVGAKIRLLKFDSPGVELLKKGVFEEQDMLGFLWKNLCHVQVSVDCEIVLSPRKQSLSYKQCGFDGLSV